MPRPDSLSSFASTRRSWFGYGNGRSNTASRTLKMLVDAPIPSASVRIATRVKAGDLRRVRNAYLRSAIMGSVAPPALQGTAVWKAPLLGFADMRSGMLFIAQRHHRIDAHRS